MLRVFVIQFLSLAWTGLKLFLVVLVEPPFNNVFLIPQACFLGTALRIINQVRSIVAKGEGLMIILTFIEI